MHFQLLALSTLATLASAIDLRAFSASGCRGDQWMCTNFPAGACCNFPADFYSMAWNLPADTMGTGYTFDNCWVAYPTVWGETYNRCFNYNGLIQPSSAKWEYMSAKKRAPLEDEQGKCEQCREPDVYIYTTPEGEQRIIDVPAGEAKKVAELAGKNEWKELEQYKPTIKKLDLGVTGGEVKTLSGPKNV